ncbi:hypothetical protein [Amycolatopsis sp. NPDC059657]|uniref:hypothetical protein n=1 Tax=Amycolatopsis sp. NPDC059657 TaxID=3346899 RepID=UPI00366E0C78
MSVVDTGESATQDSGSSVTYRAGFLVEAAKGRYGAVSVEFIDPPVTYGNADCAPWMPNCESRDAQGGTVVITGPSKAAPTVLVEFFRSDRSVPFRLYSTGNITPPMSTFWQGGAAAANPPLDVDSSVKTLEAVNSHII